jgi:hypothetical protein
MAPPPSTAVTPMPRPCACGESCTANRPCHCCLAAEVEALREKVKQHEVVFKVQAEALKSTREQVQRVRDVCNVAVHVNDHPDVAVGWLEATASVLRALDGDA